MSKHCAVAIVGAGPYGLSLAAHLHEAGVPFRIFGKPLSTWRDHMPKGMSLKSEGFASNLSSPAAGSTLKSYCKARNLDYADQAWPVPLATFMAYADWFRTRYVPSLEEKNVASISRGMSGGFALALEDGEKFEADNVVLAVGITWFAYKPELLSQLPDWAVSHSFDHHDVMPFKGRRVVVLGSGASAIDTAAALHDVGADVEIIARADAVRYHAAPDAGDSSFLRPLTNPPTGIGPGWRSFFCANTPLLFHRLPERFRLRATRSHLGPAPGWFMRDRVEGKIPTALGQELVSAQAHDGRVELDFASQTGTMRKFVCDHVIAATGYKPDLARLPFLSGDLLGPVAMIENTPILSDNFETSLRNLYVVGPAAANAFGPLMRFMVGAEFVAPRLAAHLLRRFRRSMAQRAA
jgi:thioredoxin reductase